MKTHRQIFFALTFFCFVVVSPVAQAKLPSVKSDQKRDYLVWGKNYKIVWSEEHYNANLKRNIAQLVIDQKLISKAPRYLVALLALQVYNYSNGCAPTVRKRETYDHLMRNYFQCSLNSSLGVGHQCSGTQTRLLNQYFPDKDISKRDCTHILVNPFGPKLVGINVTQENQDTFTVVVRHNIFWKNGSKHFFTFQDTYKLVDGHFIEIP